MSVRTIAAALMALAISSGTAFAWGQEGHRVVGSIADKMLNANAKKGVKKNLGFTLRVAAPWPDCVRSIVRRADGTFDYAPGKPVYRIPCTSFETAKEKERMKDYAARNWQACVINDGKTPCQDTYHYTDVATQHDHYDGTFKGANNHDVVNAINAAIKVLKDQPAPAPFSIRDKKEALFLLTHFVGDLHQPLHVGAVYLDANGKQVDPDQGTFDPKTETAGGNLILKTADKDCKGSNLHSEWDDIPKALGTSATPALVKKARAVPATSGPMENFAVAWATDSILASHSAFQGVTFTGACKGHWLVRFASRKAYLKNENKVKQEQLAKGGARLAQLLNTIWP